MKRLFLLMGMMALLFGVIAGCGKDDSDTTVNSIVGDTSSTEFQTASEVIEGGDMLEGFFGSVEVGLELIDNQFGSSLGSFPGSFSTGAQSGDTLIISSSTHSFTNGWHVFVFSILIVDNMGLDTLAISGTDSVKLTKAGVAMETPDSTFDAIFIRAHFDLDASGSNVDFTLSGSHSIDVTSVNLADSTDLATLNATGSENMVGVFSEDSATCNLNITTTATMTNIVFCIDCSDCPTSGAVNATIVIAMSCQDIATGNTLVVNGTWTYGATIKDGLFTQTFSKDNTTWTTTEQCVSGSGDGGIQSGPAFVRF